MSFLTHLRERFTHHPSTRDDPLFGKMEQAGPSLWQTTQPLTLLEGLEPVTITIEGEAAPDAAARAGFEELQRRYSGLKAAIAPMLCKTAPRVRAKCLWEHAALTAVEIWRDPATGKPVYALEYQLDDAPEYSYVVRVENYRPVEVLIVG